MSINCSNACIIVLAQASVATHIVKSRLALQTDLACYDIHFEIVPLPSVAILNVYIDGTVGLMGGSVDRTSHRRDAYPLLTAILRDPLESE